MVCVTCCVVRIPPEPEAPLPSRSPLAKRRMFRWPCNFIRGIGPFGLGPSMLLAMSASDQHATPVVGVAPDARLCSLLCRQGSIQDRPEGGLGEVPPSDRHCVVWVASLVSHCTCCVGRANDKTPIHVPCSSRRALVPTHTSYVHRLRERCVRSLPPLAFYTVLSVRACQRQAGSFATAARRLGRRPVNVGTSRRPRNSRMDAGRGV